MQRLTLYLEPRETHECLQRSKQAAEECTHARTHTRQCHKLAHATPRVPSTHPVCPPHTHPPAGTLPHMDLHPCGHESTDLVIQTHTRTCVHTHTPHFQAGCCFGLDACCRHILINSDRRERTIPGRSPTLLCELPRPLGDCLAMRRRLRIFQLGNLSPERCGGSKDRYRCSLGLAS